MGVTIHYRGTLTDIERLVDFEDRVLDLALELGGQAKIWRSADDADRSRMIRGVLLNLCPGQETTSLLVSPEGWLINLFDIEDAKKGTIDGPSECFVKTQFGTVEGHVALVEMLTLLKREFLPDLEVTDEGEYWETRNLETLVAKFKQLEAALNGIAEGLEKFGLSEEAAEDREILVRRIERIAGVVHRTLSQPAEHPPVDRENSLNSYDDAEESESVWDDSFKENRRMQERVQRAIEEHLAQGEKIEDAFESAMLEETALGLPAEEDDDGEVSACFSDFLREIEEAEADADAPWKASLPESVTNAAHNFISPDDEFEDEKFHPLQQRAHDLYMRIFDLAKTKSSQVDGHLEALFSGAGDMVGGLAQALGHDDIPGMTGLSIVQLKRAMRGAAYALGSLVPLRAEGNLDDSTFDQLHSEFQTLQDDIFAELSRFRKRLTDE
jgi:hypothetical protein